MSLEISLKIVLDICIYYVSINLKKEQKLRYSVAKSPLNILEAKNNNQINSIEECSFLVALFLIVYC